VRFVLHLLVCSSWCSSVPVAGLLLVDWVVPVRPPTTEPGECMDRSGGSTDKWHAYSSALLMGFEDLFVVSGSGREFHPGFFFITGDGEGSACGSEVGGGEDRWCSFKRLAYWLDGMISSVRGALFKVMDVNKSTMIMRGRRYVVLRPVAPSARRPAAAFLSSYDSSSSHLRSAAV
jgi:hypothetical protein